MPVYLNSTILLNLPWPVDCSYKEGQTIIITIAKVFYAIIYHYFVHVHLKMLLGLSILKEDFIWQYMQALTTHSGSYVSAFAQLETFSKDFFFFSPVISALPIDPNAHMAMSGVGLDDTALS